MGGSGGGYFSNSAPSDLKAKLRDSDEATQNAEFETELADLLSAKLTDCNDRDVASVNRHLDEIKKALDKEIDGFVDLLYAGSVAKHTYVDGLSDIDSLVALNNTELEQLSPAQAKEYFADRLRERFPKSEISVGNLAVTIKFSDAEIQLLPAVKSGDHFKIANRTGKEWSEIRPRKFATALTSVNQQLGNKVVPTIKLAKAIIASLPEKHKVSGYHAESLAIEAFKSYDGGVRQRDMLKHFFTKGSDLVNSPIVDKTGQSRHVDDYLGRANSLERKIVSDAFSRIARKIKNGVDSSSLDAFEKILEG